jgi:pimeloyl-ACP methyl ester carboxylesterase
VAIDLAAELGQDAARDHAAAGRGLVIESTFTSLADVAAAVANTSLPVRWLLSQKFDSIDKIAEIHMPLLVVHGMADAFVPPRFSEQLFNAARQPKRCCWCQARRTTTAWRWADKLSQGDRCADAVRPAPRVAGPAMARNTGF